ncbi:glutathione S-transferase family protein [Caenispirillum bisanense]|uniref:GST-like protein n=1 Tax=Caenispirillum bisanense TaxID=414052 RepID=A0A286G2Z8_9PROT|nr:glutathione S-transferase N-terminal domain-containing protein [Caenispirillum bisanense]SOD89848.1 GST-like protein [Caenispirillum bisanense]
MIDLYTWKTPNGRKVSIALEEMGLRYAVHAVDLSTGAQKQPDFLKINPNGRIPAIVDSDGPGGAPHTVFESGAILLYLGARYGAPFYPEDPVQRSCVEQWLMFQMGGIGPMFGQAFHFRHGAPEPVPYALERYDAEVRRLFGVLETRLGETDYLGGLDYSIADMATYPWVVPHEKLGVDLDQFPNVARWHDEISERPAVKRGMQVP